MKKKLAYLIASFFGSGFAPAASGTFGSLASFVIIIPAAYFYGIYGIVTLSTIAFFIGWIASCEVLKYTDPHIRPDEHDCLHAEDRHIRQRARPYGITADGER